MQLRSIVILAAGLAGACGGGGGTPGDDVDAAPAADAMPDAGPGPADDIGFTAGAPLPAGEWVLVNEWAAPDSVFALAPGDLGGDRHTVLTANRSWSMGASADGAIVAFSSADPHQTEHFGLTIGDAIQNSFAYAPATGLVGAIAPPGTPWQNVNDECHEPTGGGYVYVCRRYDFVDQPFSTKGWRIGRLRTDTGAFEFLRPDDPTGPYELNAQAIGTSSSIVFELWARPPAMGRAIYTRDLTTMAEVRVRDRAARPVLAPDGHTVLFQATDELYELRTFDLADPGAPAVVVSPSEDVGDAAWSPDGQTIVYSVYDATNVCDHLEQVTRSGAAWSAPVRVRDCTQTGEFITDLSWITVP